jgi:predicted kinase
MVYFGMTYGIAGSGKSTLARFVAEKGKFPTLPYQLKPPNTIQVIVVDQVRKEVYGKSMKEIFGGIDEEHTLDPQMERKTWLTVKARLQSNIKRGIDTILDSTALTRWSRDTAIAWVQEASKLVVYFLMVIKTPFRQILLWNLDKKREASVPQNVLYRMLEIHNNRKEQPNLLEEKWDFVYCFEPMRYHIDTLRLHKLVPSY